MILWHKDSNDTVLYDAGPGSAFLNRETFLTDLRNRLKGRVIRAYTFGSFNTDQFRPDSDIDLLLVCECDDPFYDRARRFADLYDLHAPMDILVYRPDELDVLLQEKSGFWKSVAETMKEV